MKRRAFLQACVSLLAASQIGRSAYAAEQAEPVENLAFILDCSASMAGVFPVPGADQGEFGNITSSRFDEARTALLEVLGDLAISGQHRVALWLFGHRLTWETGVEEPRLLEQTAYFEHTLGFEVLESLLPGDDVQAVRTPDILEPKHLGALKATLNVVRPWGEEPLYLALRQTVENQPRHGDPAQRRIVVLTDGGHHQGLCRFRTSKDQVLDSLRRQPAPIHIVYLGEPEALPRQTASDFLQIARVSQGRVHTARNIDQLSTALNAAIRPPQPGKAATPSLETVSTPLATTVAAAFRPATIEGSVRYYGRAVAGAQITLSGDNATRLELKSDAQGAFRFDDVPAGNYQLITVATIKNKVREDVRNIVISQASSGAVVSLEIRLD